MRLFWRNVFCPLTVIFGFTLSGCSSELQYQSVNLDNIVGKTMEEFIKVYGAPVKRTPDQLVYEYETEERVTPIWGYILMLGVAGGGGGSNIPDIDYINEDYYFLTLNFEDNILVSHSATDRKEDEGC